MKNKIRKIFVIVMTFLITLCNAVPASIVHAQDLSNSDRAAIIHEAEKHVGKPYVLGGNGPDVFDCSGYTKYVFKHSINFTLERTAESQRLQLIREGKEIDKNDKSKWNPGDLVFFGNHGEAEHVAIYYGDNKYIHAIGDKVQITGANYLIDKNGQKYQVMTVVKTVEDLGGFRVLKQDENGNSLAGATFHITSPDGNKLTRTTDGNGYIEFSNVQSGNYVIQEVSSPDGFLLDSTPRTITVNAGDSPAEHVYSFVNKQPVGEITLTKYNEDKSATVAGTSYYVTGPNGYAQTHVTNAEGKIILTNLKLGTYTFVEQQAADGYLINGEKITVTLTYKDQNTAIITGSAEQTNKEPTANVEFKKVDNETGNKPQGDAVLQGAEYQLTAAEDIYNKAGTHKFYSKGEVVATRTTDANGNMESVNGLPLGFYQFKETKPSEGYLLDQNIYDIHCDYEGQTVSVVTRSQTSKEQVKKQAFEIIKVSAEGSVEAEKLEGIEFTVKLKSDVDKNGWDAAATYDVLKTDKKGYDKSIELPYGIYLVRETKSKEDYVPVDDFTVQVTEDSRTPQEYRVLNNAKFRALIKAVKVDAETGKTVLLEGTTFKIKNLDTDEYVGQWVWFPIPHFVDTFTTDESGTVTTPDNLECGNYQLEEIKAPYGYVIDKDPIKFKVTTNTAYEMAEDGKTPVITVTRENKSVKGKISVNKIGEQLTSIKQDDDGDIQFIYENKPVNGAQFTIKAGEDIYTADNQGDLVYKKGEVVAKLTTSNGIAETENLPLGKYTVEETLAGDSFVLNKDVKEVELTYKDQETSVVFTSTDYENERQKAELSVIKKDKENGQLLKGAVFGLYAKTDIVSYDGKVLIEKGKLIEKATSDENGKAVFKADLPLTKFEVREISSPIGYASSDHVEDVDASYQGQDVKTISLSALFENEITKVEVSKKDITTGEELPGAQLTIREKDGPVYETWVSGEEPHIIKGLEPGKTYLLIETSSPYGFSISQTVEFTIDDTGEIQKVEMKDELVKGRLKWLKTGEVFTSVDTGQCEFGKIETPVFETRNITDAQITIYAAEDITLGNNITYWQKDEKIQTLDSKNEAVESQDLLVGKYYYMETVVPSPFVQDNEKHYFEIKDNQNSEIQIIENELVNHRAKVNIDLKKVMEKHPYYADDLKTAYEDVVFGIFTREDVKDYTGELGISKETMVAVSAIDKDGKLINVPDLPIGSYYIKELATNDNYQIDKTKYDFKIEYQGKDIKEINIEINEGKDMMNKLKRTDVIISKIDKITKEPLSEVEFTLYDKDMNEIMKAVSDKEGIATFDALPNGIYYCKETKARDGYALSDEVIKIELDGNSKNNEYHVTMTNVLLPADSIVNTGVQTGDTTNIGLLIGAVVISGVCVLATLKIKKRKNGKK